MIQISRMVRWYQRTLTPEEQSVFAKNSIDRAFSMMESMGQMDREMSDPECETFSCGIEAVKKHREAR